jgi:hypothetical protein
VGQNPSRIDRQIVANRDEISATLDAIAYKVNVPARIAERSDVILSDAVTLVDSVATQLSAANRAASEAIPAGASSLSARAVPIAFAFFAGMLVGLTWPKKSDFNPPTGSG